MGGEITWECLNNGQFIFTLKVYRDCNGIAFATTNHALEVHNYPTAGVTSQIQLDFFSVTDITPSCEGSPCATLTTADPDIQGAIEEYILKSDSITLNGVPPANGWVFTWTYGDRNAAIDNIVNAQNFGITLRAKLFSPNGQNAFPCFDSSPDFFQKPSTIICAGEKFTYNHSAFDNELDSLSYSWAQPLDGNFCTNRPCTIGALFQENVTPVILAFDAANGYSFDNPYPDTSLDVRNVAATLDSSNGEISFTSYNTGEFVSVIRVEAFRCGEKVAEIYRELQTVIASGCASNEPPIIPPPFANGTFSDTVKVGDYIDIDISVFDSLRADNPKDDSIFFYASGFQFGSNYTDSTMGCANPPCATLSSPAPDTGVASYSTKFRWQTTCDHIATTTPSCIATQNTHTFVIRAFDDFCPAAGQSIATLSVTVRAKQLVASPNLFCADVRNNGHVQINWDQPTDPDSAFFQWKIYRSTDRLGPYALIDSLPNYDSLNYIDSNVDANLRSYSYIVRAESGCHDNWTLLNTDTISTIYADINYNGSCVNINWNNLSFPLPSGSGANYDIYREYPVGSGFILFSAIDSNEICDFFNVCTDTVSYRIILSNSGNGCSGSQSNTFGIRFQQPPPLVDAGDTLEICAGQSIQIGGSPTSPSTTMLVWSPADSINNVNLFNPTVNPIDSITYIVTVTDSNNCIARDSIQINVRPSPSSNAGVNDSICLDDLPYTLNGTVSQTNTGRWIGGSGTFNPDRNTLTATYQPTVNEISSASITLELISTNIGICDADTNQVEITFTDFSSLLSITIDSVSCQGASDGSIKVTALGIYTPYSYRWDTGSSFVSSDSLGGLNAGNYSLTITNGSGCDSLLTIAIDEPLILSSTTIEVEPVSCNGITDGEAAVIPSGGTTPYSFSWNTGQSTDTISGLSSGNYTVTVTDKNACTTISSLFISEPTQLNIQIGSKTDVSCNGVSDGKIDVVPSGGTPPYSFNWSNGSINDSLTNIVAGTYTVTITDANACTDSLSIKILQPTALSISILDTVHVSCFGLSDGEAIANAQGGTLPYTYLWSNGQTSDTLSNVPSGSYTITITDNNNCNIIDSIQITEPNNLIGTTFVDSNVSCRGFNNGQGHIEMTGGTFPYTYSWSNGGSSDTIFNLLAGGYTVTVSDTNGCSTIDSLFITEPTALDVTTSIDIRVSCNGLNDGRVLAVGNGGTPPYQYNWNIGQTTDTAFNVGAGSYTVTITDDNGCTDSSSISINQPNNLLANSLKINDVSCNGLSDGSAFASASGGTIPYTYAWSDNQTNDTALSLIAGIYSIIITDNNGCNDSASIQINEPSILIVVLDSSSNILCTGNADGAINISTNGGTFPYTYQWNNGNTSDSLFGLSVGQYSVTVTDNNGCTDTLGTSLTEPDTLRFNFDTLINVRCKGQGNGQIKTSASGGTFPYSFQWSNSNTTDSIDNLLPGKYTLSVADANNCLFIDSADIVEPDSLFGNIQKINQVSCNGGNDGSAFISPLGGTIPYTYNWSGGQTTDSVMNLAAGTYSVTVTDSNNCQFISSTSITDPLELTSQLSRQGNVSCFGFSDGYAFAIPQGGTPSYSYAWSNGTTNDSAANLVAGKYFVTISDSMGCNKLDSFSILQPPELIINSILSDVSCNSFADGKINLTLAGGTSPYSYQWSNGLFSTQIDGLDTGNYSVIVQDRNGCILRDTFLINEPDNISVNISSNDTVCVDVNNSITAIANGGNGGYTYTWNNNLGNGSSVVVRPSQTTNYSVTVTDVNNCPSAVDSMIIFVRNIFDDPLDVTASGDICQGDSSLLSYIHEGDFGQFTYIWSPTLNSNINPQYVQPAISTLYKLEVIDVCGNTIFDSVEIRVSPPPSIDLNDTLIKGCEDLIVNFNNNSSDELLYNWDFGDGITSTAINPIHTYTRPGRYNVILSATNPDGCTAISTADFVVEVLQSPFVNIQASKLSADLNEAFFTFFDDFSDANSWIWKFGDGRISQEINPTIKYDEVGTYDVSLRKENQLGCLDSGFIRVQVNPDYDVILPNAFTPNPNGSNGGSYNANDLDNYVFHPFVEFTTSFEMLIFNRWGELIFESKDVNIGWDGYYKGELCQADVYVYKLNITFEDGSKIAKVGDITLLR